MTGRSGVSSISIGGSSLFRGNDQLGTDLPFCLAESGVLALAPTDAEGILEEDGLGSEEGLSEVKLVLLVIVAGELGRAASGVAFTEPGEARNFAPRLPRLCVRTRE